MCTQQRSAEYNIFSEVKYKGLKSAACLSAHEDVFIFVRAFGAVDLKRLPAGRRSGNK